MSTRTQIGFYNGIADKLSEPQVLIYKHHDGYLEGVLPVIVPILKDFQNNRGLSDIEYGAAWLVAKLKGDYLNIGICTRDHTFHGDIEYYYAVYSDGTIKAYTVGNPDDPSSWSLCYECNVETFSEEDLNMYLENQ